MNYYTVILMHLGTFQSPSKLRQCTGCTLSPSELFLDYITQTPFEIYEETSGRIPFICASNHFLTHKRDCPWYGQVEE